MGVSRRLLCICKNYQILGFWPITSFSSNLSKTNYSKKKMSLTLCSLETAKWVHLQTVKAQMKCPRMQQFIRVCTVCKDEFLQTKKYIFWGIITCDPSIYTMDHPGLTVSNFMEKSIGIKWVNLNPLPQSKQS